MPAGLRVPEIHAVLCKQYSQVTWIPKDIHNPIQKLFPGDRDNDPENLLLILKEKNVSDPDDKYDFCLDQYNRLEHLF